MERPDIGRRYRVAKAHRGAERETVRLRPLGRKPNKMWCDAREAFAKFCVRVTPMHAQRRVRSLLKRAIGLPYKVKSDRQFALGCVSRTALQQVGAFGRIERTEYSDAQFCRLNGNGACVMFSPRKVRMWSKYNPCIGKVAGQALSHAVGGNEDPCRTFHKTPVT